MVQKALYYCEMCGNIVEMEYEGGGTIVCCGEEMKLLTVKTGDPSEKHVPFIEKKDNGVLVKVGKETAHPMDRDHYIVFIAIVADGILMRKYLKPDEAPEAFFETNAKDIVAYELCNKHGVWSS